MLTFIENPQDLACYVRQRTAVFSPDLAPEQLHQSLPRGLALDPRFATFCLKRQAEFIGGRLCSYAAFAALFSSDEELEIGCSAEGLPLWPKAYTGSITHSNGLVRAAVAPLQFVRGIGIDSEKIIQKPLDSALGKKIVSPQEASYFSRLSGMSQQQFLSLVFSAKESFYKCLSPHCGVKFYFSAAALESISTDGSFICRLQEDISSEFCKGFVLQGSFSWQGNMVHTAIVWPI